MIDFKDLFKAEPELINMILEFSKELDDTIY